MKKDQRLLNDFIAKISLFQFKKEKQERQKKKHNNFKLNN